MAVGLVEGAMVSVLDQVDHPIELPIVGWHEEGEKEEE
jgi:hypothetical protein